MIIYLQMIESDEDKSKFEQLYIMYKGLMFHVAMKILKNEFDAEDAVHQAFLSLIENLKKISDVKCPKTRAYIVIITERKAIDIIRSRSKLVDMEFWESTYGIEIPLPGDHGLADAMARLPAAYRDILLLRYYNGYSVREISSMLHIKKDPILDGATGIRLQDGASCDILLPFDLYRYRFTSAEWNRLEQSNIWLQVTNYPTRKIVRVNIGEE